MYHYREKTSTFFTRIANGFGGKHRPVVVPLPKSLRPPVPQISLIFELPDELILSILSYISPDPQLTGHYARFRVQYCMRISNYHQQRVRFLLSLSMTCRAMRIRLLPWIWECVECLMFPKWSPTSEDDTPRDFNATMGTLRTDLSLAASVKFMSLFLMWGSTALPSLVRCLESLPNLHTLEIGWANGTITTPLKRALKRVRLPQIKTLIIPPEAYPLLRCCCDVEDVVCVTRYDIVPSDEFLGALASNRGSKVRRLAIPLVSWGDPYRHVVALTRLTELTLMYPHPHVTTSVETGTVHSATLGLVGACRALLEFDTLQIVHIILGKTVLLSEGMRVNLNPTEQREQAMREQMKGVRDLALESLRKAKPGRWEGRKVMLRVIELSPYFPPVGHHLGAAHLGPVKVEGFEV